MHVNKERVNVCPPYLSNTLTNLCIALYCILLYCVVLNCIILLIYCYVDRIQYNAMHKFVGVLDNPQKKYKLQNIQTYLLFVPSWNVEGLRESLDN